MPDDAPTEADAAYSQALAILASDEYDIETAAPYFRRAADLGGPDFLWGAMRYFYRADDLDGARIWTHDALAAEFARELTDGITVSADLFQPFHQSGGPGIHGCDVSVQILSTDPILAARALTDVARRWRLVSDDGVESKTFEELEEHVLAQPEYCSSPAFVSEPIESPRGPWIYADTDGVMFGTMARTLVTIVMNSLIKAGLNEARIGPSAQIGL